MERIDRDRRRFLLGRGAPTQPLRPPWTSQARIESECTGCGDCASACPALLIVLADGFPEIRFGSAECTFCGLCRDACTEPVFDAAGPAFAHEIRIGRKCFAMSGIVCQSCSDSCPESAIRFTARLGGAPLPSIEPDRCTGCGACIATCPGEAITAIAHPAAGHG